MANRAAFSPHLVHFNRLASERNSAEPAILPASNPSTVLAAPHALHSIRNPAPKRQRSPVVRMCLVDILPGYADRNDSRTLGQKDFCGWLATLVHCLLPAGASMVQGAQLSDIACHCYSAAVSGCHVAGR